MLFNEHFDGFAINFFTKFCKEELVDSQQIIFEKICLQKRVISVVFKL